MMVKSRAISVMGLILGMNFSSYHCLPLVLSPMKRVDDPGDEGDAQVDEDAFGDLPDGDVDRHPFQPEPSGQDGDEDVGIDGEEEHLKDGIEGHQSGAVFPCPRRPDRSRR